MISENHVYKQKNIFNIRPFNQQEKPEIMCRRSRINHLIFEDTRMLNISSIKFTSCTLRYTQSFNLNARSKVELLIVNCEFYSSDGALVILPDNKIGLTVIDTMFLYNTRSALKVLNVNVSLIGCQFIGNTANSGGAVYSHSSRIRTVNSVFKNM